MRAYTISAHRQDRSRPPLISARGAQAGFTLLEVMLAMAVLAIALMALLALHHQSLQSVIHGQDITQAAQLAQAVMSAAEMERFPNPGVTKGNFESLFPKEYPNFRWQRIVSMSGVFPDVCKVQVIVLYGPNQSRSFSLTEFLHNPIPIQQIPGAAPPQNTP
ncbi:MAG TPA: prepilin-type N-terminal cleavage/methylation domain-containing protein [Candidatus Binataceae bacterium]|nr:prepilin-type N-terminal cleavage/methylation domain-containing protein [Candidatus Binataceae bacterium]